MSLLILLFSGYNMRKPPRSKLDPTAWQSSLSSSMWAALCRQMGAGQGAPEEVVLSRAGLQIPQGKSVLLQEGGAGRQAQVL